MGTLFSLVLAAVAVGETASLWKLHRVHRQLRQQYQHDLGNWFSERARLASGQRQAENEARIVRAALHLTEQKLRRMRQRYSLLRQLGEAYAWWSAANKTRAVRLGVWPNLESGALN